MTTDHQQQQGAAAGGSTVTPANASFDDFDGTEPAAPRLFFEPLKCQRWHKEADALIARRLAVEKGE